MATGLTYGTLATITEGFSGPSVVPWNADYSVVVYPRRGQLWGRDGDRGRGGMKCSRFKICCAKALVIASCIVDKP